MGWRGCLVHSRAVCGGGWYRCIQVQLRLCDGGVVFVCMEEGKVDQPDPVITGVLLASSWMKPIELTTSSQSAV